MSHIESIEIGKVSVLGDLVGDKSIAVVSLELPATTSRLVPPELLKPVLWVWLAGRAGVVPLEGGMVVPVPTSDATLGSVAIGSTACWWGDGGVGWNGATGAFCLWAGVTMDGSFMGPGPEPGRCCGAYCRLLPERGCRGRAPVPPKRSRDWFTLPVAGWLGLSRCSGGIANQLALFVAFAREPSLAISENNWLMLGSACCSRSYSQHDRAHTFPQIPCRHAPTCGEYGLDGDICGLCMPTHLLFLWGPHICGYMDGFLQCFFTHHTIFPGSDNRQIWPI